MKELDELIQKEQTIVDKVDEKIKDIEIEIALEKQMNNLNINALRNRLEFNELEISREARKINENINEGITKVKKDILEQKEEIGKLNCVLGILLILMEFILAFTISFIIATNT